MTEVWWDPKTTGLDELGRQGTGMWQFVDGGKRYLPGQWPKDATRRSSTQRAPSRLQPAAARGADQERPTSRVE